MADLQALIFGLDGVIIANTPVQARAFQLLFRDLEVKAEAAELLRRFNGTPAPDLLKQVFGHPVPENYLDLRRFFDVVVGADNVDAGKPHPETYVVVAEKLGVVPANCLVSEDAILGEHAAYQARMHDVAVTTTLEAADFQAPLLAIQDFTGLPPEHLRNLFSQVGEAPQAAEEVTKSQNLEPAYTCREVSCD